MSLPDDTLITLKDACETIFGGKLSPATLKDQWRKGNLELSLIGRSYFASVADFKGLKTKCLVDPPARASGSIRVANHGPSSMADPAIAQGSALRTLSRLKEHFGTTSKASTSRPKARTRSLPMSSQPTPKSTSRTSSRVSTSSTT